MVGEEARRRLKPAGITASLRNEGGDCKGRGDVAWRTGMAATIQRCCSGGAGGSGAAGLVHTPAEIRVRSLEYRKSCL